MDRLWNRNYCKVMTANFTLFFAFYVLTPLLPLYLSEHFGATKDVIGLVLSGYTITALLFRPFSGYVVDSFPRKTVLMIAFGAFAIFFAGYLAASTLLLFMIVRTLHGGPFGALTVANSTAAIDVLPSSRRTEGIGYYGLSNNLAMAIAPTIGIFIYQLTDSFEFLFWLALIVACLGWLVDATVQLNHGDSVNHGDWLPSVLRSRGTVVPVPVIQKRHKLSWDRFFLVRGWLIGVNMVAFGFSFGVLSNYLAIYGKEVMGIMGGTGTYFMLCSVGLILSRLQGGKALRNGRVTHNAAEGMVISLIGYTLFILMPTLYELSIINYSLSIAIGYYGSALLIGLGNGHMWPAFQNMTINVASNNRRGTANSTILISWDIGMGLGILVGGVVSELLGYAAAFWTVVLVNASGVACFFLATKAFFLKRNLNETVK
ncbi:MAG: MFS transporter [Prevotella sp.]|nr:MFS transporter [Prevotella sp.]